MSLYVALKVPFAVIQNTKKFMMSELEFRRVYNEALKETEAEILDDKEAEKKVLTRDEVLDAMTFIEDAKLRQFKRAMESHKKGVS